MKILLRNNNPTVISYIEHVLSEAGIIAIVMDEGMSSVEGSIGMLPRRIMVADDQLDDAVQALKKADLEHELEA